MNVNAREGGEGGGGGGGKKRRRRRRRTALEFYSGIGGWSEALEAALGRLKGEEKEEEEEEETGFEVRPSVCVCLRRKEEEDSPVCT